MGRMPALVWVLSEPPPCLAQPRAVLYPPTHLLSNPAQPHLRTMSGHTVAQTQSDPADFLCWEPMMC